MNFLEDQLMLKLVPVDRQVWHPTVEVYQVIDLEGIAHTVLREV